MRFRLFFTLKGVAVLTCIVLSSVGFVYAVDSLDLPNELPDGSSLVSTKDVFTKVADEVTAQQLRTHMPHVLGGTEYRYVLEKNGQIESEWGIVVFEFESEQIALEDFQHLANEVAFVNKNPRFVRIEGADDVPEIQAFLDSDLEYACLMNEIVIFPLGKHVIWVDDYTCANLPTSAYTSSWRNVHMEAIPLATTVASMLRNATEKLDSSFMNAREDMVLLSHEALVTQESPGLISEEITEGLRIEIAYPPNLDPGEDAMLLVELVTSDLGQATVPDHENNILDGSMMFATDEDVRVFDTSLSVAPMNEWVSYERILEEDAATNATYAYKNLVESIVPGLIRFAINPLGGWSSHLEMEEIDIGEVPTSTAFYLPNDFDLRHMAWTFDLNIISLKYNLTQRTGNGVRFYLPFSLDTPGEHTIHIYVFAHFKAAGLLPPRYTIGKEYSITINSGDPGESSSVGKALDWLRAQQHANGYWDWLGHESVGITALATLAFLNAGYDAGDQTVKAGLDYIVSQYDDEGWISAGPLSRETNDVYDTSMALLPLVAARHANYNPLSDLPLDMMIKNAAQYLVNNQCLDIGNPYCYGGWGYPREGWGDLSNSQWALLALEAVRRDGISASSPNWGAAATFVARSWNDSRNPYSLGNDGGFIYRPQAENWGGGSSYGSMTGAGVWSLLICGWNGVSTIQLAPGNSVSLAEVLQKGLDWLEAKDEVQSNTNAGEQWYYYYLVTVAKAYLFAGENIGLDWYNDMTSYLTQQLQKGDGHFPSVYGEEPDVMATAEAVLALQTRAEPPEILQNTELWIVLASHADLHVYDSAGRHVGRDYETGLIDIGIPGASYRADGTQAIGISRPSAGRYRIELVGTSDGAYSLTVEGRRAGKKISSENFSGIIEEGEKHSTTATLTSIVGPLTVFVGKPRPLPEGLYAILGDGQIELHWRSYTDPGFQLAGYNVYCSTRSGGGYTRVNASLISGTEYTDKRTKSWKTYYYVITAVDRSGNETGYSPEAEGIAFPQGLLESIVRLILGILQAILSLFGL